MVDFTKFGSPRLRTGLGAAALLVVGIAGGAGTVAATRPAVEMAPAQAVPIASLAQREGLVTVKGKVAEVYGDRFTVADASGKTMVDAGRGAATMTAGAPVMVQGRYMNGQLRASFLVDSSGTVEAVGPGGHRGMRGPGGPGMRGGPDGMRGPGGPGRERGGPDGDRRGPPMGEGCAPDDSADAPAPAPGTAAPAPAPAPAPATK